jgi:hypothetical protein
VDSIPTDQDTQILIQKNPQNRLGWTPPDYEILQENEEIAGEPVAGKQDSYQSWQAACDDWKKELRADNGDRLISANCGRPHPERDNTTMLTTQTSQGNYKLKVQIRNSAGGSQPQPGQAAPATAPSPK